MMEHMAGAMFLGRVVILLIGVKMRDFRMWIRDEGYFRGGVFHAPRGQEDNYCEYVDNFCHCSFVSSCAEIFLVSV